MHSAMVMHLGIVTLGPYHPLIVVCTIVPWYTCCVDGDFHIGREGEREEES